MDGARVSGRRAERRRATGLAIRRAAFRLIGDGGYAATSTEQIALAAGVSPRTFFNYFETKEALFFLPEQPLAAIISVSIGARPPGEDPVKSIAVAAIDTFELLENLATGDERQLMLASLGLLFDDPDCRRFLEHRREVAERAMTEALGERGVPREDVATRTTISAVIAACWVALAIWVERDGTEPLPALLARCLLGLPDPVRLAAGVIGHSSETTGGPGLTSPTGR
jgi:AcrR family transcriptional regulator